MDTMRTVGSATATDTTSVGLALRRGGAVVLATVAAVAVWAVAEGVFGVDVHAPGFGTEPAKDVGAGAVVVSAFVAGVAGWVLLGVLDRVTSRARPLWLAVATVVLVVSFGGPLSPGIGTSSRIVLLLVHVAMAAVLMPLLAATGGIVKTCGSAGPADHAAAS